MPEWIKPILAEYLNRQQEYDALKPWAKVIQKPDKDRRKDTVVIKSAYAKGRDDRVNGKANSDNPYRRDIERKSWAFGWQDADRDIKRFAARSEPECEHVKSAESL